VRSGGVAERFKAPVLKTGVRESVPWVRIPPPPPATLSDAGKISKPLNFICFVDLWRGGTHV
jgi:hypothetical protein